MLKQNYVQSSEYLALKFEQKNAWSRFALILLKLHKVDSQ